MWNLLLISSLQSTHPCAGCDPAYLVDLIAYKLISIHAPLCGVRHAQAFYYGETAPISIHAPLCGVRRMIKHGLMQIDFNFNPRTPVRGATKDAKPTGIGTDDFNPRTPVRGATVPLILFL